MSNLKNFRKAQLAEFRDLFIALFKIPDKDVQRRVIDAINGVHTRESSTQTDSEQLLGLKIEPQCSPMYLNLKLEKKLIKRDAGIDEQKPSVKRRRRNKKVPRVEKFDASKDESVKLKESSLEKNIKKEKQPNFSELLNHYPIPEIEDVHNGWLQTKDEFTKKDVIEQMKLEWKHSEQYDDFGYYPIHHAIRKNDINKFKRQCYVFEQKRKHIDEVLTENNETPIQLALTSNCFPDIIKLLLKMGSDINQVDRNGNTLLHLTILNTNEEDILSILLNQIELNFLEKYNDNGLTALHCAVIQNKFDMCKIILEYINLKTDIESIGKIIKDEQKLHEIFIKELNEMPHKDGIKLNKTKCKIINQVDLKHFRTALFFALERKSKLLTFLLLVNLADPTIEDGSGIDCLMYAKDMIENVTGNELLTSLLHTSSYLNKCSRIT